jgi:hypothetical protein
MPSDTPPKPSTSDRIRGLLAEWGPLFAIVWFGIFGIVLVGFALAIKFGFRPESAAGEWGTWGAAWVATQLTKPLRLAATVVITPALGALLKRFKRAPAPAAGSSGGSSEVPPGVPPLDETSSGR